MPKPILQFVANDAENNATVRVDIFPKERIRAQINRVLAVALRLMESSEPFEHWQACQRESMLKATDWPLNNTRSNICQALARAGGSCFTFQVSYTSTGEL